VNNDHEFISVVHDRITVAHEFITWRHDSLPGSHDSITVVHARMTEVTYLDIDDHEWMTVSHEFVMIGSVRENFDSSQTGACNHAMIAAVAASAEGVGGDKR